MVEDVTTGQIRRPDHGLGRRGALVSAETGPGASHFGDVAAQHPRDEFEAGDLGNGSGVDQATVAQDRHAVAEPKHLVQPVGDIHDGDAIAPQNVDDLHQSLDLPRLERGSRLVHDHDPMVGGDGPGDRDHLLDAEAEFAQRPTDVHIDAVPGKDGGRLPVHPGEVDQAETVSRLAPEEQIPRDADQGDEVDLLVDRC